MNEASVKRLVFLSAFGVGGTFNDANLIQKIIYSLVVRNIFADKAVGDRKLMQSKLDWTLVYPTGLTYGRKTERYRSGGNLR